MLVYADNDLLYKLSAWNLLPLLGETFSAERQSIRILDTLAYRLKRPGSLASKYGADMVPRLLSYIDGLEPLTEGSIPEAASLPLVANQIDAGERVLLAATGEAQNDVFYLASGDKKMMRALPQLEGYEAVRERLRGRIVCLEQVLWLGVREHGCEYIRAGVSRNPTCDSATRIIFGSTLQAPEPQVEEGFLSYVKNVQQESGGLLYQFANLPSYEAALPL